MADRYHAKSFEKEIIIREDPRCPQQCIMQQLLACDPKKARVESPCQRHEHGRCDEEAEKGTGEWFECLGRDACRDEGATPEKGHEDEF